jgi:hypothetical protein
MPTIWEKENYSYVHIEKMGSAAFIAALSMLELKQWLHWLSELFASLCTFSL